MRRISRKIFFIWAIVLMCTLILIISVFNDVYLRLYWLVVFLFASWSILQTRKKVVNAIILYTIFYVILFAFGPMILYIEGYSYYVEVGNYIIISYLCFAVGYALCKGGKINYKPYKIFLPSDNHKIVFAISIVIFCIGAVAYSLYFIRNWRAIYLTNFEDGRVSAMTGNGLLLWLGRLTWLGVYMVYEQRLLTGKYKKSFIAITIISALFSILLGFRSSLVNPILILFLMKNKKKEIPLRRMIGLAALLFAFVGIYGAIRGGTGSSIGSLLNEFKVSSVNLNNILGTFPNRVPYQMGATYLLDFRALFNDDVIGTTLWLKNALRLSFSGGGVTPTIIGEFYINWGIIGVLIGMILTGALFKKVDHVNKNPNNSIFLSCLFLGYVRPIIRGGYANSSITLLFYLIGYCGCQYIAKRAK